MDSLGITNSIHQRIDGLHQIKTPLQSSYFKRSLTLLRLRMALPQKTLLPQKKARPKDHQDMEMTIHKFFEVY